MTTSPDSAAHLDVQVVRETAVTDGTGEIVATMRQTTVIRL